MAMREAMRADGARAKAGVDEMFPPEVQHSGLLDEREVLPGRADECVEGDVPRDSFYNTFQADARSLVAADEEEDGWGGGGLAGGGEGSRHGRWVMRPDKVGVSVGALALAVVMVVMVVGGSAQQPQSGSSSESSSSAAAVRAVGPGLPGVGLRPLGMQPQDVQPQQEDEDAESPFTFTLTNENRGVGPDGVHSVDAARHPIVYGLRLVTLSVVEVKRAATNGAVSYTWDIIHVDSPMSESSAGFKSFSANLKTESALRRGDPKSLDEHPAHISTTDTSIHVTFEEFGEHRITVKRYEDDTLTDTAQGMVSVQDI